MSFGKEDLYVSNDCNINDKSLSNLGTSYKLPDGFVKGSIQAK